MTETKRHKLGIQFLKYLVGGSVYFWSGLLIFAVFYSGLHWGWLPAKLLSDIFGWTANYAIQRYWAFSDKRLDGHSRQVTIRYVLVNSVALIIDYGVVGGLKAIGITPYIGFFVSAGVTTFWDYLWYRFWVFKPDSSLAKV